MQNSHSVFSFVLNAPAEAMDWLEKKLNGEFDKGNKDWEFPPCKFERDAADPTAMVIRSEEEDYDTHHIGLIVETICELQERFSLEDPFSFTWAEFDTGEEVVNCHGGAVVCHQGQAIRMDLSTWELETLEQLLDL